MKSFLCRVLLFSTPVYIYVILAVYIDPFNIIHKKSTPLVSSIEKQISYKINYPLYKIQNYIEDPTDIILLGDSRTNSLKNKVFEDLIGLEVSNLAYGGGTLVEIIQTFWYIVSVNNIKQAYIGINFNLYNEHYSMNRVDEAIKLIDSPLKYIFSSYCLRSTYLIIKSLVAGHTVNVENPNLDRTEFWNYQLETTANNYYRAYKYPESLFQELKAMLEYSKNEGIKLVFFIPPTHTDLQEKVHEFKLDSMESRFKKDLASLGEIFDFDYENEITTHEENFLDPFHFNDSISQIIIREIVTENNQYAKKKNLN